MKHKNKFGRDYDPIGTDARVLESCVFKSKRFRHPCSDEPLLYRSLTTVIYMGPIWKIRGCGMETVLVVEDSRVMQRTLQRLFESDGCKSAVASDGVCQALRASSNRRRASWYLN